MQFKDLEWKDVVSDGVTVCSHCEINLCGVIRMEFRINHEPKEDKHCLYSFGKGNISVQGATNDIKKCFRYAEWKSQIFCR